MQPRLPKPITCLIASLIALIPLLAVLSPQVTRAQDHAQTHAQTEAQGQSQQLTAANLRIKYAYRVPSRGATGSTGFTEGGGFVTTVLRESDGKLVTHLLLESNRNNREILHYATSLPGGNPDEMPLASLPTMWPQTPDNGGVHGVTMREVFGDADVVADGETTMKGLAIHPETGKVIVTARDWYGPGGDSREWMATQNDDGGWSSFVPQARHEYLRQPYFAGGVTFADQAFADEHLNGNRLLFACGGFTSGTTTSCGPTAASPELDRPIMAFASLAAVGKDGADANGNVVAGADWSQTWDHAEKGFADYGPVRGIAWVQRHRAVLKDGSIAWLGGVESPDVDPADIVSVEGSFGSSSIRGGACWVDTTVFRGLLYVVQRPVGKMSYRWPDRAQTENLSLARRTTIYTYTADQVAASIEGRVEPDAMRGNFFDFHDRGWKGTFASWDALTQTLWIGYQRVWREPHGSESYPIIVGYELIAAGDTPDPEPEPTPDPEPEPDPTVALLERLSALEKAATANSQAIAELIEQMQALTSWSDATDERWRRLQAAVTSW